MRLIVVDVQNDFCAGGALGSARRRCGRRADQPARGEAPFVVATRDWHPPDHHSFAAQGGPWPVHCVRDTAGRAAASGLDADRRSTPWSMPAASRDHEGYSGFERTDLERLLRDHDVDTVHVAGLALDYCVKATALDAKRPGFDVVVHRRRDARRSRSSPATASARWQELRDAGVESSMTDNALDGRRRARGHGRQRRHWAPRSAALLAAEGATVAVGYGGNAQAAQALRE